MIVVGGLNTAVEKLARGAALQPGRVNRIEDVRTYPGGKGLHVAATVAALEAPVRLVGIIDAAHRGLFEGFLGARGVEFVGVKVAGAIRTCLAIQDPVGGTTEILEPGPTLDPDERGALCEAFLRAARGARLAVLTGSAPDGFGSDVYGELVAALAKQGVPCLLDASGERLRHGLLARPYLVKPNREEAEALAGRALDSVASAGEWAREVGQATGTRVVVSLGSSGAAAWADGRVFRATPPHVEAVNTVGSGDCLLGGLAVGLARELPFEQALRLGVACGTANALSAETGLLRRVDVDKVLPGVGVDVGA